MSTQHAILNLLKVLCTITMIMEHNTNRNKKVPCYMRRSACRWFIAKKLKYFEVMLNIFEFLWMRENAES